MALTYTCLPNRNFVTREFQSSGHLHQRVRTVAIGRWVCPSSHSICHDLAMGIAGQPSNDGSPKTLYASRRKWLRLLAIGMVFSVIGVLMVRDGNALGWLPLAFFGLGSVVSVWQVASPAKLVVGSATLESLGFGRRRLYELRDCGEFAVWRNPFGGNQMVVFDYPGEVQSRLARANRKLAGASSSLPETYGLEASDLADLLNQVRATGRLDT